MRFDPEIIVSCALWGLALAALGYFGRDAFALGFGALSDDLADKLRRLRAKPRRLRAYLIVWLALIVATLVVFIVLLESLVWALLAAALLGAIPYYIVRRMAERHRRKIEDQLADAMVTLANAVRAGLSLPQSLEILSSQCPRPINLEFQQIVGEYRMGKPLERTLLEAKDRLRSENFALFAAAMLAAHESGGRLNETVERIAQSVLEMQRLERKVSSETAQARKSAVYMALAPALILTVYYFVDPQNTTLLFTTVFGQVLLGAAVVLNVVAYLWARMLLNPDI